MLKVLIPAAAALGLIAFAATTQATDTTGSSDAQPGMAWHVSYEGPMAKLAYGVENSDQLALMITCAPGDRAAVVYGDVQPVSPRLIRAAYSTAVDPLSGGEAEETRLPLTDPSLASLSRTGRMQVEGEAGRFVLTADRDEQRAARDFIDYCSSSRA
ncbi:MAG: hypothetical protein EON88_03080 [Brevundimonas sp.]|nr:MAG: hypothetical protein EON88_03080 [Brevundimonas sp.]